MPGPGGNTQRSKLEVVERRHRSVEMRRSGKTFQEVADAQGVSIATAYKDVKAHLQAVIEQARETAEEIRQLELDRLDNLLSGVWEKAKEGDPLMIDRAIKIMERRAKMLGIDAPTGHALTSPDGSLSPTTIVITSPEASGDKSDD